MAKKTKIRLPKTVMGFKLPKRVRKSKLVNDLLASPIGRKVVADALVAGAGAAATILLAERKRPDGETRAAAPRRLARATEAMEAAADAMRGVAADAARSMLAEGEPGKDKRKKGKGKRKGRLPGMDEIRH